MIKKNDLKRWRTSVGLAIRSRLPTLVVGVFVGVLAGLRAPTVTTRADASGQAATYGIFLAAAIALFVAFAAVPKLKQSRLRAGALAASVLAVLASVAGLLDLPPDLYTYTFAVTVAALVAAVLSLAVLLR